jgi:uncharacterized tellurite resistance protein B-like protein
MLFGRFLHPSLAPRPNAAGGGDTEAVRRIVAQLESLPPEQAAHLAGFAYILARVVAADSTSDTAEVQELETLVAEFGGVPEALAVVVVEIARSQSRLLGATEDYLVTRRFREVSSDEERQRLLHCLFAVATPGDRAISAAQNAEIHEIADELGFTLDELNEVRRGYADRLAVVRYAREAARPAGADPQATA